MTTRARIYRPTRTATQQGSAQSQDWVLEFDPAQRRVREPLMGWVSSGDTRTQLRLRFPTREEAVAYAEKNGIAYDLDEPKVKILRPKSYAANFAWNRIR
ncbi:MAG: ETC complex I subunit [Gemmatimonas sp.]